MSRKVLIGIIVVVFSITGSGVALVAHNATPTKPQSTSSHSPSPSYGSEQNTPLTTGGLNTSTTTKPNNATTTPSMSTPAPTPTYSPTPTTYTPPASATPDNSACLSDKQAALASIQEQINQTQAEINSTPATVQAHTSGYLVTQAQLQVLINNALQPLYAQLSSLEAQYQIRAQYPC